MDYKAPLNTQEGDFEALTQRLLLEWKNSEAGILRIENKVDDGVWVLILSELRRLCRKFIHLTPSQVADGIRDAHRKQLDLDYPKKVNIRDVENELHAQSMLAGSLRALPSHSRWYGTPSECLDRNWPEIWEKAVFKSIEKREKIRAFDWEYIDVYTNEGREMNALRDRAFLELKRRVGSHADFSVVRLRELIRVEMHSHLVSAFPKYVGDIERQVFTIDFDHLNALAADIYATDNVAGGMRFMVRPNVLGCERLVCFDLYAEMMGCKWPEFPTKDMPKKDIRQMPRFTKIPTSIDDL